MRADVPETPPSELEIFLHQEIAKAREKFFREWAVPGMPGDKKRIVNEAWTSALEAATKAVCNFQRQP